MAFKHGHRILGQEWAQIGATLAHFFTGKSVVFAYHFNRS